MALHSNWEQLGTVIVNMCTPGINGQVGAVRWPVVRCSQVYMMRCPVVHCVRDEVARLCPGVRDEVARLWPGVRDEVSSCTLCPGVHDEVARCM